METNFGINSISYKCQSAITVVSHSYKCYNLPYATIFQLCILLHCKVNRTVVVQNLNALSIWESCELQLREPFDRPPEKWRRLRKAFSVLGVCLKPAYLAELSFGALHHCTARRSNDLIGITAYIHLLLCCISLSSPKLNENAKACMKSCLSLQSGRICGQDLK